MSTPFLVLALGTRHRNSELEKSLRSLGAQQPKPTFPWVVMVVDNSETRHAEACVSRLAEEKALHPARLVYIHHPIKGIPHVRNRALEEALRMNASFLAFMDDDTEAAPDWLAELLQVQHKTHADVVTGPQDPVFPQQAPRWATESGMYESRRLPEGAPVGWAATHNVLVSLDFLRKNPLRFDTALALSGGADQMFFMECKKAGARMVWTNRARVTELVTEERLSIGWLMQRNFRYSSLGVYFHRRLNGFGLGSLLSLAKGGVYIAWGMALVPGILWHGQGQAVRSLCFFARGTGWLGGVVGLSRNEYQNR